MNWIVRSDAQDLIAIETEDTGGVEKDSSVVLNAGITGAEFIHHGGVEGVDFIDSKTPHRERRSAGEAGRQRVDRGLAEVSPGVANRKIVFLRGLPINFDIELVAVVAELLCAGIVTGSGRTRLRSRVGRG